MPSNGSGEETILQMQPTTRKSTIQTKLTWTIVHQI